MCEHKEEIVEIAPDDLANFRPMTESEKIQMGKLMAAKMRGDITNEEYKKAVIDDLIKRRI